MSDGEEASEDEQRLVKEIDKEISKLGYFLEETEELIEIKDYTEMEIVNKRAGNIITTLSDLVSQTEELKIERGLSPRSVRQWKKDIKAKYAALVNDNEKLRKCLSDREEEITQRKEDLKRNQQMEDERITRKTTAARAGVVEGKARRRNAGSGEEIRNGENRRFKHHKIAQIEDNTVQRNCR